MKLFEFLEIGLRWAWGTLLTAMVTAVLTVFLRHGRRWFRPVQKFLRTGRWTGGQAHSGQTRGGQTHRYAPTVERVPRLTATSVLQALGRLSLGQGSSSRPPTSGGVASPSDDVPLNLKF